MTAKLVVTARRGGSQIALVGASGAELLASKVFSEPRAKGATLRSLKALMGEDILIEDHTLSSPARKPATRKPATRTAKRAVKPARSTARGGARTRAK